MANRLKKIDVYYCVFFIASGYLRVRVSKWKPTARRGRRPAGKRSGDTSSEQTGEAAFSVRREGSIQSEWKPKAQKRKIHVSPIKSAAPSLENITEDPKMLIMDSEIHEV